MVGQGQMLKLCLDIAVWSFAMLCGQGQRSRLKFNVKVNVWPGALDIRGLTSRVWKK